ncbi:MAG: CvpA family protein [Candidatus Cloacimonetes bacterium]|jgi:membrane protein required for colicin V production|nr:CvpA family protein [Candidatus Cloacimonadota bacterium]NLO43673.1 CvpA family protein [Candidatus Cloacimonadota bacterium]
MGLIDWIILINLAIWILLGVRRGLVGAIVQLGGGILTFFLIGHYYPLLASQLMLKYNQSKVLAAIISVILIAVLFVVVIRFVTWILNRFVEAIGLTWINRLVGGVLGFINGILIIMILMSALDYFPKLSDPLKDGANHRVYAGIDIFKEDVFNTLKLDSHLKYIKMPQKYEAQDPIE